MQYLWSCTINEFATSFSFSLPYDYERKPFCTSEGHKFGVFSRKQGGCVQSDPINDLVITVDLKMALLGTSYITTI